METNSSYVIVCPHYLGDLSLLILCIPVVKDVNLNDCYKEWVTKSEDGAAGLLGIFCSNSFNPIGCDRISSLRKALARRGQPFAQFTNLLTIIKYTWAIWTLEKSTRKILVQKHDWGVFFAVHICWNEKSRGSSFLSIAYMVEQQFATVIMSHNPHSPCEATNDNRFRNSSSRC